MGKLVCDIWVPGIPKPGGSKRGFIVKKRGAKKARVAIVDDCSRNADWMARVAQFGRAAYTGVPINDPLRVAFFFVVQRPKNHFGSGRNSRHLKPSAPAYPDIRPDTTKFIRSTEDALTGVVWRDDARIVDQLATKRYGPEPGCRIMVELMDDGLLTFEGIDDA